MPQPASISDSSASGGDSDSNTEAPSDIPWAEAKPSLTHMALAGTQNLIIVHSVSLSLTLSVINLCLRIFFCSKALVKTGKVKAIITQNVDGLHTKSGVPDRYLMELHGSDSTRKMHLVGHFCTNLPTATL